MVSRAQRRLYKRLTAPLSEDQKKKLETRNTAERARRSPPNPPGLVAPARRRAFRAKLAGSRCQAPSVAPSRFTGRNRPHRSPKSFASARARRRTNYGLPFYGL